MAAARSGGQQYNYSASVILGVCQGPVAGFGTVWWDKNTAPLVAMPGLSTINLGADGQPADPFWVTNHPAKALGYSGTANITLDNYQLGMTAALPNFSFEVIGIEVGSGVNGFDANPAAIITDFLTNPRYGAGFPAANLDSLTSIPNIAPPPGCSCRRCSTPSRRRSNGWATSSRSPTARSSGRARC